MKYLWIGLWIVLFWSCVPSKKVIQSPQAIEAPQVADQGGAVLGESDQRRFDYFFYEGIKERLSGNYKSAGNYFVDCLKIDPSSGVVLYEVAKLFLLQENFTEAEDFLRRAIHFSPENSTYKQLLADLYIKAKNLLAAIALYQDIVKLEVSNEQSLYILAMLYKDNQQFSESIDFLNQLESKIGLNDFIALEKEKLYLLAGKPKLALAELQALVQRYPNTPVYYSFIGDHYQRLGNVLKAEEYYWAAIKGDEENSFFYFHLAGLKLVEKDTVSFSLYFMKGLRSTQYELQDKLDRLFPYLGNESLAKSNPPLIKSFFQVLMEMYPNDWMLYALLGQFYGNSDLNGAVGYYESAVALEQHNEELWHNALVAWMSASKYSIIDSLGQRAIESFPGNPFFRLLKGASLQMLNRSQDAIPLLQHADTLSVDYAPALQLQVLATLGDCYFSAADTVLSFQTYERALRINSNYLPVLNNYSYYLSLSNQMLDKAESMSMKCVELEPGNATYLDTYAWVLFKRGRYFEAKFIIERAIDHGGALNEDILHHYGDILWFNADPEEAVIQWNKAIKINPSDSELIRKVHTKQYHKL